jgi:hypothetical protein
MSYGGASKAKGCGQQDAFEGHFLFCPSLLCCVELYIMFEQCI